MNIDIQKFLKKTGLAELFYPGKKYVRRLAQPGENKSHAIVYDWSNPDLIRVDLRAGLSGKKLAPSELVKYPVSLQTETFLEIAARESSSEDDESSEEGRSGKGSASGGRKPAKKKGLSMASFSKAVEGQIPSKGEVTKMVVMGMEIAKDAYENVLDAFINQADKGKVIASDLLSKAGKFITKYAPPAFMEPKGEIDKSYQYNRERNESMFGMNLTA